MKKEFTRILATFLPTKKSARREKKFSGSDAKEFVNLEHAKRVNRIANISGAKKYLEIGVNKGHTFLNVEIDNKIAVDPVFLFDFSLYSNTNSIFHEKTSDTFFDEQKEKIFFDICLLDGLHVFEQTLRDLMNAVYHSHENSIFIIDDVHPCDRHSIITDQQEAYRQRERDNTASSSNFQWHGDIFKICFYIHDFMPFLSYSVNIDEGNGILIAWYEPRTKFVPRFPSLGAISSAGYDKFLNNKDLLNIQGMNKILQRLARKR